MSLVEEMIHLTCRSGGRFMLIYHYSLGKQILCFVADSHSMHARTISFIRRPHPFDESWNVF
jgi:hypothetical protein